MDAGRAVTTCPRCGATVNDLQESCPNCGAVIGSRSRLPTVAAAGASSGEAPFHSGRVGRLDDSGTSSLVSFSPGQVLGGRFRIIGMLGRGGMGEVYRADDLELGQAVALKFLPRSIAQEPGVLERFRAEVRNARRISHPNVCRVYDIGEYQGQYFLSMEFVDGEDLAALLRRIGRLADAKANEVASQLCAGLAAAHDKGVLHRDLKPSNVMLDGEGHVRITDFGLAVRMGEGAGEFAGTPAYMAPEQFDGGATTVRSDLYSLGLILYEIYTGRRPFEATSVAEWKAVHSGSLPTLPSGRGVHIDDAVERAILRCLEKDPTRRPSSVRVLGAALPGGDPLAAALAAGETPSPEMVAAAGGEGALAPRTAWLLTAAVVVGISAVVALSPYSDDLGLADPPKSPDVLRDRAGQLLDHFGYGSDVLDRASWIERPYGPMLYVSSHESSTRWRSGWRKFGAPILFFYRQSPRWMLAQNPGGRIGRTDPPHEVSDMATVALSGEGKLRYLRATPIQLDTAATAVPFAWNGLFEAAGLDTGKFRAVRPTWVPSEPFEARAEWVGTAQSFPSIPLRISAASYGGRPVYFEIIGPWFRPERMERPTRTLTQRIAGYTAGALGLISMVAAFLLTRRNWRLRRGDAQGAAKLAGLLFVMTLLAWLAGAHHVPAVDLETMSLQIACGAGLLSGGTAALLYVAVEPYVRRRMPELMIGWARLLEGRIRDARVGRDVLVGAVAGTASALILHASNALPTWIPILGQTPVPPDVRLIAGGGQAVASLVNITENALAAGLFLISFLFLLRIALRKDWAALLAAMVVLTLSNLGGENVALETPFAMLQGVLAAWVIGRAGLLAVVSMWFFRLTVSLVPMPIDPAAPYALTTALVLGLLVAIVAYALRISIGSRPLLSAAALDG